MLTEISRLEQKDVVATAKMESEVIIKEVFSGNLPYCDLGDLSGVASKAIVDDVVREQRILRISEDLRDKNRHIYLAKVDGIVVGRVGLRLDDERGIAIIYGLYIKKSYRGTTVAFDLINSCFSKLEDEDSNSSRFSKVRTSRYEISEKKKPFLTRLAKHVNEAIGGTVLEDQYEWKGNKTLAFTFNRDDAKELFCEIGSKYLNFL